MKMSNIKAKSKTNKVSTNCEYILDLFKARGESKRKLKDKGVAECGMTSDRHADATRITKDRVSKYNDLFFIFIFLNNTLCKLFW